MIRFVDIRRQYINTHLLAFIEILDNLVGVVHIAGEEGGQELGRIMGLQICGLVGDQGVGRGMGFVKAIAGKLCHQVKDIGGLVFGNVVAAGTCHEFCPFLFHDLGNFLAHGPAEDIGITQAVRGQDVGYFHNLLLVDNNSVGLFQHRLDLGQRIFRRAVAMLGLDKLVHHAGVKRSGPVQGHQGDEVGKLLRCHLDQQFAHAVTFQLEDTETVPLAEQVIGLEVIHGDLA